MFHVKRQEFGPPGFSPPTSAVSDGTFTFPPLLSDCIRHDFQYQNDFLFLFLFLHLPLRCPIVVFMIYDFGAINPAAKGPLMKWSEG